MKLGIKGAIVALLALLAGCGSLTTDPVPPNSGQGSQNTGGDIEGLLSEQINHISLGEGLSDNTPPSTFDTNFDYYAVVFLWGTLHPTNVLGGPIIDWSGSISFNGVGEFAPIHPIRFESPDDTILPVSSPTLVEWKSTTLVDNDGIAVILRHDKRVVYITPPTLKFSTPLFNTELGLDQLERFFCVFPTDSTTAVAVMAHRINPNICRRGRMAGVWIREDETLMKGRFKGLWFNHSGDTVGRYLGTYWMDDAGDRRIDGVVTDLASDDVRATVHGTWWYDDPRECPSPECGTGHGRFVGKLTWLNGGSAGELAGEFGDMTHQAVQPMRGHWVLFCPRNGNNVADQAMQ